MGGRVIPEDGYDEEYWDEFYWWDSVSDEELPPDPEDPGDWDDCVEAPEPFGVIRVAGYRPTWDEYFLSIARAVAARSGCERDKVGAVVVAGDRRIRATGYNGGPSGSPSCSDCPRRNSGCNPGSSYDNCIAIHAEANALLYCDRADLIGATLYVTREPCYACSKLIAGAGITKVVTP